MSDSENELASQTSELEEYSDDEEQQNSQFQAEDNDSYISEEDDDEDDSEKLFKPAIKIGNVIPTIDIQDAELESDDESIDNELEDDEDDNILEKNTQQTLEIQNDSDSETEEGIVTDDEDDDNETYLQKIDREVVSSYIQDMHPESIAHNYDEVRALANVVRDERGIIIDELHRTIPIMTKFEKTRILGTRAKQLDDGAQPFVNVQDGVIDGYTIALEELTKKAIPFIIKRPIPNGGVEYWRASDLELI